MVLLASVWTNTVIPIGTAGTTFVAASAAVGALYFAWRTVTETQGMRAEARDAAERAAYQAVRELTERKALASADSVGRQIVQIERISDLLLAIVNLVERITRLRAEKKGTDEFDMQVKAMQIRLGIAVSAWGALGGTPVELSSELSNFDFSNNDPTETSDLGVRALGEINELIMLELDASRASA